MSAEAKQKKTRKASFGIAEARAAILDKLTKAAGKGVLSLFSAKAPETKRVAFEQAVSQLDADGILFVDRHKAKPRFYLAEYKPVIPDAESVATKLCEFLALKYPLLLSEPELKRAVPTAERVLVGKALDLLKARRDIVELGWKKTAAYIDAGNLRNAISTPSSGTVPAQPDVDSSSSPSLNSRIIDAYQQLVRETGFPAVPISSLRQESKAPLADLHEWILSRRDRGHAVLSLGDWSLADEQRRAAAIEIEGERYLLVRLRA